jgi:hypothetical protein
MPDERQRLTVVVLAGPKKIDQFIHACDVFEPSKCLATPQGFDVSFKGEATPQVKQKVVEGFRKTAESVDDSRVVAVFIPGDPESAFIDTSVKVISDGHHWTLLSDFLRAYRIILPDESAV